MGFVVREKNNQFAFFNLLRFIGSVSIAIFLHYHYHFLKMLAIAPPYTANEWFNEEVLYELYYNSYAFVEMFFILLGILFTYAYKKKIYDGLGFDKFILGRFVRIYPLVIITSLYMYFANVLLLGTTGSLWSSGSGDLFDFFTDSLFGGKSVFNVADTLNGTIWYINVLMFCYIIAYAITYFTKKNPSVLVYSFPIILGLAIQYNIISLPFFNESTARGLIAFFIGVILGELLKKQETIEKPKKYLLNIIYLLGLYFVYISREEDHFNSLTNYAAFGIFPLLILLCSNLEILNKICSTKFVKYLGNISFGIYLWNFPIYITLHLLITHNIIHVNVISKKFMLFVLAIHMIVATISYYAFEKPVGKRLSKAINK